MHHIQEMKNSAQIIVLTLVFILILSCCSNAPTLPESKYKKEIPEININRNIFLRLSKKDIYCKNEKISSLKDIREYPWRFTEMNEGSNVITLVIQGDKNLPGGLIDSVFYELTRNFLFRIFLQTNALEDSVGLRISSPILFEELDELDNNPDYEYYTPKFLDDKFIIKDMEYHIDQLYNTISQKWEENKFLVFEPAKFDTYQQFVRAIEICANARWKQILQNSIESYGKQHMELTREEKDHVERQTPKRYMIRLKKYGA